MSRTTAAPITDDAAFLSKLREAHRPLEHRGETPLSLLYDAAGMLPEPFLSSFRSNTWDMDRDCLLSGDGRYVLVWDGPKSPKLPLRKGNARLLRRGRRQH